MVLHAPLVSYANNSHVNGILLCTNSKRDEVNLPQYLSRVKQNGFMATQNCIVGQNFNIYRNIKLATKSMHVLEHNIKLKQNEL